MPGPRLLIIGPAATRSGAPLLLLHLIRWMKRTTDYQLSALMTRDGGIGDEFAAELPTHYFDQTEATPYAIVSWFRRRGPVARRRRAKLIAARRAATGVWPPDLVFCASVGAGDVLDALGPYPCPVVVGVHEMRYALGAITWVTGGAAAVMTRHATHYVAGSDAVRRTLLHDHGVPDNRVTVVHDFVPTADFPPPPLPEPSAAIREAAGVPAGAAVVGVVATVEWRKGADLLVSLARLFPATDAAGRPVHFVWVGGGPPAEVSQLRFDVETAGVDGHVHVVGATGRTVDWYPLFDVLAMLAREDPMPLVAAEAAASGVPIVCFDRSGGVPELVGDDAGRVVPYLDLVAFAGACMEVLNDRPLRVRLGRRASEKARAGWDVAVAAPKIVACFDRALNRP